MIDVEPVADSRSFAGIVHPRLQTLIVLSSIYFAMGVAMDLMVALLPSIAATFAVTISVAAWVVTVRSAGSLVSPFFGVHSDGVGRKQILLLSLTLLTLANLGAAAVGGFVPLLLTQGIAGLGFAGLQVSVPAYLGDLVPYGGRGRAIGLTSMWIPIGITIGVPVAAFITQTYGLAYMFLGLGIIFALQIPLALAFLIPLKSPVLAHESAAKTQPGKRQHASHGWLVAMLPPFLWVVMAGAVYIFLSSWLTEAFSLQIGQIGLIWALLGSMSVLSSWLVAVLSDRLGKRRSSLVALILAVLCTVLLAQSPNLWIAILVLLFFVLTNDYGQLAYTVVVTELLPERRGTMISANIMATGLAITITPLLGGLIWQFGGFSALTLSLSSLGVAAFVIAAWFLHRGQPAVALVDS